MSVVAEKTRHPIPSWYIVARWRQGSTAFKVGALILLFHLVLAVLGPFIAPYALAQMGTGIPLSGASWAHPFGVDQLGRDIFSRVINGGHIVIILSLSGTATGLILGSILGLLSGYLGGWFDNVLQRLIEAIISIPLLVFALLLITAAGPEAAGSPFLVVLVVALVYAPRVARMARAAAIEISTRDFVTVARLRGETAWSVLRRELLPNATSVLLVEFALRAAYAPILVGSLGFLGFGIRPPTPEWGLMMSENRNFIMIAPSAVLGPGVALASVVIGLNLFTEGVARILGRSAQLGRQQ